MKLIVVTGLALALAACASDPNKEVKSARAEVTQAEFGVAQTRDEQAANARDRYAETAADSRREETGEMTDARKDVVHARADLEHAQTDMKEARSTFDLDANARLSKLDARVSEARVQADRLDPRKRAIFDRELHTWELAREHVLTEMRRTRLATDAQWKDARDNLDVSLHSASSVVDSLEQRL